MNEWMCSLESWDQICVDGRERWGKVYRRGSLRWGQDGRRRQNDHSPCPLSIFLMGSFGLSCPPKWCKDVIPRSIWVLRKQPDLSLRSAQTQLFALSGPLYQSEAQAQVVTHSLSHTYYRNICDPRKTQLVPESTRKSELPKLVNGCLHV